VLLVSVLTVNFFPGCRYPRTGAIQSTFNYQEAASSVDHFSSVSLVIGLVISVKMGMNLL